MQQDEEDQSVSIDNENSPSSLRKDEIVERVSSIEPVAFSTDIQVDMSRAERLPLGQLASLGVGFGSLPEAFRTVISTTQDAGEQLYRVTDKAGNPLSAKVLHAFHDHSGLIGTYHDADNKIAVARLHAVSPQSVTTNLTVPYDPTSLFMAAALMEVNLRLDDIQKTQREMFDYLKNKDRAKLRGDLDTLRDVLDNYRFNWNIEKYKTNKHVLVQSIRKDAAQAIVQQRDEVRQGFSVPVLPIHIDEDVRRKACDVRAKLEEYRLSVYLYGFSSFLEVMLLENFDSGYLKNVVDKVEGKAFEYRSLYTEAYDAIEAEAKSSVRAGLLGGASEVLGMFGKAIEQTPVGDLTPIDEALIDAGKGMDKFSKDVQNDILGGLPDACSADVRPFVSGIEAIDHLYNDDVMLLADDEAIYLLPASEASLDKEAKTATNSKD